MNGNNALRLAGDSCTTFPDKLIFIGSKETIPRGKRKLCQRQISLVFSSTEESSGIQRFELYFSAICCHEIKRGTYEHFVGLSQQKLGAYIRQYFSRWKRQDIDTAIISAIPIDFENGVIVSKCRQWLRPAEELEESVWQVCTDTAGEIIDSLSTAHKISFQYNVL